MCHSHLNSLCSPRQVRFNINQSKYIIKAKLKVSSKFGKKQICIKLKATLIHLRTQVVTAVRFLNTASAPNQSPGLKALLFHPLTPPRSSLLLLHSPSGLTWIPASSLSKRCSLIHRSYTFLWQEGFGKNGIAPCQNGVYSTETFPHCCASTCCTLPVSLDFHSLPKP